MLFMMKIFELICGLFLVLGIFSVKKLSLRLGGLRVIGIVRFGRMLG